MNGGQIPQCVPGRQRFGIDDIKCRTGQRTGTQGSHEIVCHY